MLEYFGTESQLREDESSSDLMALIKRRSLTSYEKFLIFDRILAAIKALHDSGTAHKNLST